MINTVLKNKWTKGLLVIFVVLVVAIIGLHIVERMQPNAYKRLLDTTLVQVQTDNQKVMYETSKVNGHHIVMYVPISEDGYANAQLVDEMRQVVREQESKQSYKDTAHIIYAKAHAALDNIKGYSVFHDEYRYTNGEYVKSTQVLSKTVHIENDKVLSFNELLNSAYFDEMTFAQSIIEEIKKGPLPALTKQLLEKQLTKDNIRQLEVLYNEKDVFVKLRLPDDEQIYYIKAESAKVVPYFNVNYIYDTYKQLYAQEIAIAHEQKVAKQKEEANGLIADIAKRNVGMKIAITFDDGPRRGQTDRVLDVLKKYDAKATFYILGKNIEGNEDILKRQVAEGHELGNHSWTHDDLTKISLEQLQHEIRHTQSVIKEVSGAEAKSLRPPYGTYNKTVAQVANMPLVNWNLDSNDWKNRNKDLNIKAVMKHVEPGVIILLHDIHPESVDSVEEILSKLKAKGYEFVTVSELVGEKNLLPNMIYFGHNDARVITE